MPVCHKPEKVNSKSKPQAKAEHWQKTCLSGMGASRGQSGSCIWAWRWLIGCMKKVEGNSVYNIAKLRKASRNSAPSWLHQKTAVILQLVAGGPWEGHHTEAQQSGMTDDPQQRSHAPLSRSNPRTQYAYPTLFPPVWLLTEQSILQAKSRDCILGLQSPRYLADCQVLQNFLSRVSHP